MDNSIVLSERSRRVFDEDEQRRRQRQRMNENTDSVVVLQQVGMIMIFWLVAFFINQSDETEESNHVSKQERQHNIILRILVLIATILAGFIFMMFLASVIRTNEKAYNICLYFFLIFIVVCEVAIFLSIMRSVKLEYGEQLRRKVFVEKEVVKYLTPLETGGNLIEKTI